MLYFCVITLASLLKWNSFVPVFGAFMIFRIQSLGIRHSSFLWGQKKNSWKDLEGAWILLLYISNSCSFFSIMTQIHQFLSYITAAYDPTVISSFKQNTLPKSWIFANSPSSLHLFAPILSLLKWKNWWYDQYQHNDWHVGYEILLFLPWKQS